jgi:hypothetical protein
MAVRSSHPLLPLTVATADSETRFLALVSAIVGLVRFSLPRILALPSLGIAESNIAQLCDSLCIQLPGLGFERTPALESGCQHRPSL